VYQVASLVNEWLTEGTTMPVIVLRFLGMFPECRLSFSLTTYLCHIIYDDLITTIFVDNILFLPFYELNAYRTTLISANLCLLSIEVVKYYSLHLLITESKAQEVRSNVSLGGQNARKLLL